jgi:hypothetical protein
LLSCALCTSCLTRLSARSATESGNVPPKDTAPAKAAPAAAPKAAAPPAAAAPVVSKLSGLSVADVGALLDSLGMKKYAPKFAEFAIDGLTLVECEDADLIECGVDFKPVRRDCWSLLSHARRVGLLLADSTACACGPVSAPLEAAQARRGAGGRGSCGAHGRPPPPHSHDVGLWH